MTCNIGASALRNGIKLVELPRKCLGILDDTYGFDGEIRTYKDYSPTLRSQRGGLKVAELENKHSKDEV